MVWASTRGGSSGSDIIPVLLYAELDIGTCIKRGVVQRGEAGLVCVVGEVRIAERGIGEEEKLMRIFCRLVCCEREKLRMAVFGGVSIAVAIQGTLMGLGSRRNQVVERMDSQCLLNSVGPS